MDGPTPLQCWRRLSDSIGVQIWAKRDDALSLGLGGNKIRKLDLILGRARQDAVDTILTTGGLQSNHCRLTAAAAASVGMGCTLFLRADPPVANEGNILLDQLFGAELIYTGTVTYEDVDELMLAHATNISRVGGHPLVIPLGAATTEGTVAYVEAVEELALQCESQGVDPRTIIVAVGSGSTFAGIRLGVERYLPQVQVIGVSASWAAEKVRAVSIKLILDTCAFLDLETSLTAQDLDIRTNYIGPGYTIATSGARTALHLVAATEGVLLDLTYTGKACHALMDLAKRGELRGPVIFWHTGGFPELFARVPADLSE